MTVGAAVRLAAPALLVAVLCAQGPENVLLVINSTSEESRRVGEYYARKRAIPSSNVCAIRTAAVEEITRAVYDAELAAPVAECLKSRGLSEKILYIATTLGTPLKIAGTSGPQGDQASVDSELAMLYQTIKGRTYPLAGPAPNPVFAQRHTPFDHPRFPVYLVTRLAAYTIQEAQAMIDRAFKARNRGAFVFDLKSDDDQTGNDWLRTAAIILPRERVKLDTSSTVVRGAAGVIGYASWGSNDPNRRDRFLGFTWLDGAIAAEYVSTNGRTFREPPVNWSLGSEYAGSSQSLAADLIREGATGVSGHVYEPYLAMTPRPDYLFPAYFNGRTLAESFYIAMPGLSWRNIVIGDPLCRIGPADVR